MNFDSQYEDFKFPATYQLCSIIEGVLNDEFGYARAFDEIFSEGRVVHFMDGFGNRRSSLMRFISEICFRYYRELTEGVSYDEYLAKVKSWENIKSVPLPVLAIDRIIKSYIDEPPNYTKWLDDKDETHDKEPVNYFDDIADKVEKAFETASYEIFHILFQNRDFLQKYNNLLAGHLEVFWDGPDFWNEEDPKLFTKKGKLKRTAIPKWAKRAVFYRDRGKCVFCQRDLSGLISSFTPENFDHIIPLSKYGANDVSNLQLSCANCNQTKGGNTLKSQTKYERWF